MTADSDREEDNQKTNAEAAAGDLSRTSLRQILLSAPGPVGGVGAWLCHCVRARKCTAPLPVPCCQPPLFPRARACKVFTFFRRQDMQDWFGLERGLACYGHDD
jgi:hypothetical protein